MKQWIKECVRWVGLAVLIAEATEVFAAPQAVHTASDIPVSAYSSGSNADHQFHGVQTNTDVFFKLMRAALGGY